MTYQLDGSGDQRVSEIVGDRVRELAAPSMIAWLSGEGREATGTECDLKDVELLAPVPEPPSYRDFMNFQGHAERASRNLLAKEGIRSKATGSRSRASTSATRRRFWGTALL